MHLHEQRGTIGHVVNCVRHCDSHGGAKFDSRNIRDYQWEPLFQLGDSLFSYGPDCSCPNRTFLARVRRLCKSTTISRKTPRITDCQDTPRLMKPKPFSKVKILKTRPSNNTP